MRKLMMAGPASRHLSCYLRLISGHFEQIIAVTTSHMTELDSIVSRQIIANPSLRSPSGFYRTIGVISRAIRDFRPDVIHIQQAGTLALAMSLANRNFRVPLIVTVMGSDVLLVPKQGWLKRKMVGKILRSADFVTCDAECSAQASLALGGNRDRMTVVNFGVDDLSGGGEKKGKLIYSNRLHEPLYRIDRAIDLFFDFMAVNPGWKMVVAGQGSLSGALKEKAQTNAGAKSIEFVGWLKPEENLDFYRKASIYLSLPRSDATSVSLLEAMSAGCIPVVSDLPANREWVRDGVNGIIFNGSRENPLTRALALDPERVSGYNREMLAQRASPTKARETFIGIYEKYRDRL